MSHYFKYWFGNVTCVDKYRLYTLTTIIKATDSSRAGKKLDKEISNYLKDNPDVTERGRELRRFRRYDINQGILDSIRKDPDISTIKNPSKYNP